MMAKKKQASFLPLIFIRRLPAEIILRAGLIRIPPRPANVVSPPPVPRKMRPGGHNFSRCYIIPRALLLKKALLLHLATAHKGSAREHLLGRAGDETDFKGGGALEVHIGGSWRGK